MSKNKTENLEFGKVYHVFNRAISNELLFKRKNDYHYFLRQLEKYILPVAKIYAYCLMPNHFHLLIYTREEKDMNPKLIKKYETSDRDPITQSFSNFFNSYSKSYNKIYNRKGRLFLYPFKRILVDDNDYLLVLISYIHRNPVHHRFTKNFSDWKYSSYKTMLSDGLTNIERSYIIDLFGGREGFISFHEKHKGKTGLGNYFFE